MFLFKNEHVKSFFIIKECRIVTNEETGRESVELTVMSDVGRNTHKVIAPLSLSKEICLCGSLVQITGVVDSERRIFAKEIIPAIAVLPSLPIVVKKDLTPDQIIDELQEMLRSLGCIPLAEVLLPVLKCYAEDLRALDKPCRLRGVECPTELHTAYSLILKFKEMSLSYTHFNFDVMVAIALLNILKPLRENLFAFSEEVELLLPVHSNVFYYLMFNEYSVTDDYKV